MPSTQKVSRKQQILESLARELERNPGTSITTAGLAKAVGVSEAALYRHFASKAKMFEALIEFSEESVFSLCNRIQAEEKNVATRCEKTLHLLLGFSEKNPGITRILLGDAIVGENERLRIRAGQFYERLETQLKQFLREGIMHNELAEDTPINAYANLLLAIVEGRMIQYVRTNFTKKPTENWTQQWNALQTSVFSQ